MNENWLFFSTSFIPSNALQEALDLKFKLLQKYLKHAIQIEQLKLKGKDKQRVATLAFKLEKNK